MSEKVFTFKTRTSNGRISKTAVFKPREDIIVINQRILAKKEDLDDGWFTNSKTVFEYNGSVLREVQIVFWTESFDLIKEIVDRLNPGSNNENDN